MHYVVAGGSLKHAVMAAAVAFHPKLSWLRVPARWAGKRAAEPVLRWLDDRRVTRDERAGFGAPRRRISERD